MTTYKGIRGQTIRTIAGDASTLIAGDIWYNSSAKKIRGAKLVAAWASGTAMPANKWVGFGAGTQTSNVVAGGATTPPANGNQVNTTFEYDGSSWTAGGAINTTRFDGAGFGASNTAAIIASGGASPGSGRKTEVESYDGSTWTEVADVNTKA